MKINELKEIWDNEELVGKDLSEKLSNLNEYSSPLKSVQKMLKFEFIFTWIALVFLGTFFLLFQFHDKYFGLLFYFLAVISTIYYHSIFFRFYKKVQIEGVNTYQNFIELIIEFKYSLHLYRSYNYVIGMLIMPVVVTVISISSPNIIWKLTSYDYLYFFIIGYLLVLIVFVEGWIYTYYKKHLVRLEKLFTQIKRIDEIL